MAASSSSGRHWKYDVFINFRGEDTRKGFVSHLYKALRQKPINTFIDAEGLRKGNHLSELLTAIQDSKLSILVFSENYAYSTWCLKELVQILKCMDTENQIVVPIFFQVDPSHVRKLKKSFEEAFAQHEHHSNDMEELQSWKSALTRATNLSGWDSRNYDDDAMLIEKIVEDTFNKLIYISSSKANDSLVEMDYHIRKMDLLLCPKVDGVRVVGIWGMGGIGKTTIARAVFNEISCQFEGRCFLENVREGFMKNNKLHMQTQLLSSISNNKAGISDILNKGFQVMLQSLGKKKVFLVLDDVDSYAQIETLLGKILSFGGGSRIIITTRDMHLLSRVDAIYEPKNLSDSAALKLFRQYAFRTNQPTADYDHLSMRAIKYAQGLPLALKVLGAYLDNKSVPQWEDVLKKIKKIPHAGIHDVLRTSFDGLDDSEKNIFLDIACFFKGMEKDYATKIMDCCGFFPHDGLRVLVDRALIIISGGKLEMHDLLEEMGREIVRQESIRQPGRRSRLCSDEDVHYVFTENTAKEAVESIMLDFSNAEEVCINAEVFDSMKKLRLFKIHCNDFISQSGAPRDFCKQHLIGDLKFYYPELRCVCWHGCPLKSLPSNFCSENLVDLDMRYSHIEQLWEGTKPLCKLESINLCHCTYLKEAPDFTDARNLKRIDLDGCVSLIEVHPSILAHKKLVFLSLRGCRKLKTLPRIVHMKCLTYFDLSLCSSLEKFPEITGIMKELKELLLGGTAIKELPMSINNLTGLKTLRIKDCRELKSLPSNIGFMKSLESLDLFGCIKFEKFPDISEPMSGLKELCLDCTAIKELPASIKNLVGLVTLNLNHCRELKTLPSSICQLKSLTHMSLSHCTKFRVFPNIEENMEQLGYLHLDGTSIKELPPSIERLQGLKDLSLSNCKSLAHLLDNICNLKDLKSLNLRGCTNLSKLPVNLRNLECLKDQGIIRLRRYKTGTLEEVCILKDDYYNRDPELDLDNNAEEN